MVPSKLRQGVARDECLGNGNASMLAANVRELQEVVK